MRGRAGSPRTLEIARANLGFGAFDVGGVLGARIQNIGAVHPARLFGIFVDATHFQIPGHRAYFAIQLQVDPDGPAWLTGDAQTQRFWVSNDQPITGTLNAGNGTFSMHVVAGDSQNGIDATFNGKIDVSPVDTDGDGVPDAVDNCPLLPNPDQVDLPPVFGPVDRMVVDTCTPGDEVTLTPPAVSDACTPDQIKLEAVLVSVNGLAAHPPDPGVFLPDHKGALPSGTLVVEWTATDGNGNRSAVHQTVEVVAQPTVYARGSLKIDDGVSVQIPGVGGRAATVANGGPTETNLGVSARTGDMLSSASVMLRDRSTVDGFVKTAGTISTQNNVTVTGPRIERADLVFAPFLSPAVTFPPLVNDVRMAVA
jgi:hypothetical protein